MPRQAHEIQYLLEQSGRLDAAVAAFSQYVRDWTESAANTLPSIRYVFAESGFTVEMHGVKLTPNYEQVKDGPAQMPTLYARVSFCPVDRDNHLGQALHSILIDENGNFSFDGTTNFAPNVAHKPGRDYAVKQLSLLIASAVQDSLQSL